MSDVKCNMLLQIYCHAMQTLTGPFHLTHEKRFSEKFISDQCVLPIVFMTYRLQKFMRNFRIFDSQFCASNSRLMVFFLELS